MPATETKAFYKNFCDTPYHHCPIRSNRNYSVYDFTMPCPNSCAVIGSPTGKNIISASYIYQGIVVPSSITLPITLAIVAKWYYFRSLSPIFWYLVCSGTINAAAAILAFHSVNNLPLLHIYTIVEFLFLSVFLSRMLKNPTTIRLLKAAQFIFPVFCVFNFLFLENVFIFNSYARVPEALIIILLCISYLNEWYDATADTRNLYSPEIWITVGLLLYFSTALVLFAFLNYISHIPDHATIMVIWNIHATLVLMMYMLFTKGFLYAKVPR